MQTAKVFKSGNSNAIRIPASIDLGDFKEFVIKKIGEKLILTPKNKKRDMEAFFKKLEKTGGVDLERVDLPLQEREF